MADQPKQEVSAKQLDARALQKLKEAAIDAAFQNPDNAIIPVDLEKEMKRSFIDYAMSVISDRALPDIRDGLKPVHRRILYSMFTQGFTPDKPYRKCATTVGDVLGRFHPHGDAAVYDALVRLAQDFSMRHILVDGHGNFGSRDGDPAAAYRYTEARLTKLSVEMMANINKDTVDFKPNFDEHTMEPTVLPAAFPNLLVNGSTGIAVGMATNIPPHNLSEVIDGAVALINNPEMTTEEMMTIVKGPDFPTGGTILGTSGVRSAYRTGKGRVVVRSTCEIEEMRGGRYRIIARDLPYMVNKARLIEHVARLVSEKKIDGISNIRDESDRSEAVRIVIELKREANANVVLNQLYKNTQLQDAFNCNMLALVPDDEGRYEPQTFTLLMALNHFLDHQRTVVTRRTQFELEKAEARRHIVEGLQLAIDHIDEVISIIRHSATEAVAKVNLVSRFGFSEKQAQHVVDMRLGRLSGLEREKLLAELDELNNQISYFNRILTERALLDSVIEQELKEVKRKFGEPRRTVIEPFAGDDIDDESLIDVEEVAITLSHLGYIKRMPVEVYSAQHRGGRGVTAMSTRDEDYVERLMIVSTHDHLLFFTTTGRVYRLKGYQIPEASRQARGTAIVNILPLGSDEKVCGIVAVQEFTDEGSLIFATKQGLIKKTLLTEYSKINRNGIIAINLLDDDTVVGVELTRPDHDIVLATKMGQAVRFAESDCRNIGRNTKGVKGLTVLPGDEVISMVSAAEEETLLAVTENGFGKRTSLAEYRVQRRGGVGTRTYKTSAKTGELVKVSLVADNQDVLIINDQGVIIRLAVAEIPVLSRITQGVRLMRSKQGKVVDLALSEHEEYIEENSNEALAPEAEATSDIDTNNSEIGEDNATI